MFFVLVLGIFGLFPKLPLYDGLGRKEEDAQGADPHS
jgi:hypothetical protein